jgi:hypothetical protein
MCARTLPAAVLAAVGLLTLVGCGRTGTVSGTVTVGGKPHPHGGAVAFHPVGKGPTAVGTIGPDGRYTLAVGTDRGIPPGEYKVTVIGYGERTPPADPKDAPPAPPVVTAAVYRDPDTTPLTKTVTAGPNAINLDVEPEKK